MNGETQAGRPRVAVGMSGGIDSSVAAALLAEQGYEVIGLTLHMFKEGSRCCSLEDVQRARKICTALGIRHYVMNVVDEFREAIIKPFTDAYAAGRTPNPCIFCNRDFKFGVLLERALQLDCAHVATGHYVRVTHAADGHRLFRGIDSSKDQSYFLHRLSQDQLARCLFPLGEMTKAEVRAYAARMQLPVEGARETADLCFITGKGPAPLIEAFHPGISREGEVRDTAGRKLGVHPGIHHYTIGQRKGLGIAVGHPVYVKEIQPEANVVVVAGKDEVLSSSCRVKDVYWTTPAPPADGDSCDVKIRYRTPGVAVKLTMLDSGSMQLDFARPQFAVTSGQAAVFYRGDEVLGGGWIERL